jgi:hypothetical protein
MAKEKPAAVIARNFMPTNLGIATFFWQARHGMSSPTADELAKRTAVTQAHSLPFKHFFLDFLHA